MNIYNLLHNRLLSDNDIFYSSYDKCLVCCFIYCFLPFIEISERDTYERDTYERGNDYPENFHHMVRE